MGLMVDSQILDTGPILYLASFAKTIRGGQSIIYALCPERVPLVETIKGKEQVAAMEYR